MQKEHLGSVLLAVGTGLAFHPAASHRTCACNWNSAGLQTKARPILGSVQPRKWVQGCIRSAAQDEQGASLCSLRAWTA